jgi:hypothetical protein
MIVSGGSDTSSSALDDEGYDILRKIQNYGAFILLATGTHTTAENDSI